MKSLKIIQVAHHETSWERQEKRCDVKPVTIDDIADKHAGLKSDLEFVLGVILVIKTLISPLHPILLKEDPKILIAKL